jgi:hypothetical protein
VVAQRNLANPGGVDGRKLSVRVPTPQNVTITSIIGGIDITWDKINFNRFESYEVQYSTSSTFPRPTSITSYTSKITLKDLPISDGTIFVRVRTVSIDGEVSEFSSTTSATLAPTIWEGDFDDIAPENRTRVNPQPTLTGTGFTVLLGAETGFIGVGGAVGPGPYTFQDDSASGAKNPKHRITYTLLDGTVEEEAKTMGLPTFFNEGAVTPAGNRQYNSVSGSFVDFFYIIGIDDGNLSVRFLDYLTNPHQQTGVVLTGTLSAIKY